MKYLHVTPVVGLPQVTGWSQIAENPHTAPNRLICAFALHGEQAGNVGRDISEDISQFEPQTLEEAYTFLENLETRYQETDLSLYFAAGIFVQGQVAYAVKGGSVLLKRDSKAGTILHSDGDLKMIVGKYTLNDVIILATYQATGFFSEIEQKFQTGFDTDTIITSIVPGLHSLHDSSLSALAFVVPSQKELEDSDPILFEASLETTEEKTKVILEGDIANQAQAKDIEEEMAEVPQISPDDVIAPSEETLAELGMTESPPQDAQPNLALIKLWSLIKRVAAVMYKAARVFVGWLRQLLGYIWKFIRQLKPSDINPQNLMQLLKNNTHKRSSYFGQSKNKKIIRWLMIGGIFLVVVGLGIYLYFARMRGMRLQAQETLSPFLDSLEQAQSVVTTDPVTARESVAKVIQQLEVLQNEQQDLGNKVFVEEIDRQLSAANSLYEEISGRQEFSELSIFYDLRLVESDFVVTAADASQNTAALLDKEQKKLVLLDLEKKQPAIIDLAALSEINDIKVSRDSVYILADGVYEVALNGDSSPEKIIEEGDSNREGVLLGAYDRYIYVLNPEKRNVYRYAQQEEGEFSDPIGWMQAARGLTYDTISSWTIDGDIWMVTGDGQLRRFSSGESVNFSINGLHDEFNSSLRIATFVEGEQLYVLEPANRRFVVLGKNGDFLREVKSFSLASADSLIVSEPLNKAFAVSGSILFEIQL